MSPIKAVGSALVLILSAILGGIIGCFIGVVLGPSKMVEKCGIDLTPTPKKDPEEADQI